jgi:hypothetical protein
MSDRSQVANIVVQFFEALNSDDVSSLPLSRHVEYAGMMTPEPVCGESQVRGHLQQVAPFMLNVKHGEMIIEDGAVAVPVEFDGVNGIRVEGAFFMKVKDGAFCLLRAIFDTHSLLTGRTSQ